MRHFGLIGYSLRHSFSKSFFDNKFLKEGIRDVEFFNFEIEAIEYLPKLIQNSPQLCGFTVTIPYKTAILPFVDATTEEVKKTGALNVVKISRKHNNIMLYGYNTDIYGFEKSLLNHIKSYHNKALVLGMGGAGKAAGFVLEKLGIDYKYVTRTYHKDAFLYETLSEEIISSYPLIINATPLGMFPNSDSFPIIPYKGMGNKHFLFDMVYNPDLTLFLKKGKDHGAFVQNGYEMLCYQAEEAWRIWNDDAL